MSLNKCGVLGLIQFGNPPLLMIEEVLGKIVGPVVCFEGLFCSLLKKLENGLNFINVLVIIFFSLKRLLGFLVLFFSSWGII